ncbi:hypothetical protein ACMWP3_25870, partial [Escherichia coli]|uniref:hypothetical protein n=1 Tax=Escherichia coli TaxID=562 RepID=UPI0039E0A9D3
MAQFNANIAMLSRVASLYAPETHPLVESLHASIADIVDQLHTTAQLPDTHRLSVSRSLEGVLVEANAVV